MKETKMLKKGIIKTSTLGFASLSLLAIILVLAGIPSRVRSTGMAPDEKPRSYSNKPLNPGTQFPEEIYEKCNLSALGLDCNVLELALKGFGQLSESGRISSDSILTIVDFSRSSRDKRMIVLDLRNKEVLFHTVVSHGRNSGLEYARNFSNQPRSYMSSLGFYITKNTYQGSNGYSLLLDGCEKGINDKALSRSIVVHGADYAEESLAKSRGYLGRSFGCPAIPRSIHRPLIDKIKNGNPVFVYYPDADYLRASPVLNSDSDKS